MKDSSNGRVNRLLPVVVLAGLAFRSPAVFAGVNTWTSSGPTGEDIRALAINPSTPTTLYAATYGGGVFKSTNGGGSWSPANAGLTSNLLFSLAIDPSAPDTLYAGTQQGGVCKSTNGGASWCAVNAGLTDTFAVSALAIDPWAPATLYAGTNVGIFKSVNGGGSWTAVNTGLTSTHVQALAIDPMAPATVYAGADFGVFKSVNGGGSWTAVNTGVTTAFVETLSIDPSRPATVYAGTSEGIFRSANGGGTWAAISAGLTDTFVLSIAIDPSETATLYAGTAGGVFRSTDSGGSWIPINTGLTVASVQALAIHPSAPSTLYAGTALVGIFKSTDGGGNWTATITGLNSWVTALAIDTSAPNTLYAGTSVPGSVFKSTNGGENWMATHRGLDTYVTALAIEPSAPNDIYAGTASYDYPGVFTSTDGGHHWGQSLFASVTALVIDPSAPRTVYAGTFFPGGVFRTTDGGLAGPRSWTPVNSGLQFDSDSGVVALAIDPSMPSTLYAGTSLGVFKTVDAGGVWNAIITGLTSTRIRALAIDPSHSATLYAGTSDGGVFKSTNGGQSWIAINAGLTTGRVSVLAVDPTDPATVYAGTPGSGVFKSTNAGGSWTPINAGLANLFVNALVIDPSMPTRLYAGTNSGVYEVHDYLDIGPCVPGPTTLCLGGGRFKVTTQWTTAAGQSGSGRAVALPGGDTGYFTFFDPGSVEVAVKVLNGCGINGNFWIFAGGLTNVGVVMTVSDSQTGAVKTYTNPPGTPFQPIQDTHAFAACAAGSTTAGARPYGGSVAGSLLPPRVAQFFDAGATEPCTANATTLCLNNSRYRVRAQWVTSDGAIGTGQVVPLTADTGAFWFFGSSNLEVVVKVLNGCGLNARYWTFAGGLTDVNVILTVTDTQTGTVQTYVNPQGRPFEPIQDTDAFATCP
jgi:photosystem II stability/assembly factor-like uncharacterized protein